MPSLIDTTVADALANYLVNGLDTPLPETLPVVVANRDAVRTRPTIVVHAIEFKVVPPMGTVYRGKVEVMVFTQSDDTPVETHAEYAETVGTALADVASMKTHLNSETFTLVALLRREVATLPDGERGRETTLEFEAIVASS